MYVMRATGGEAGSTWEFGVRIYQGLFLGSTRNLNALVSDCLTFLCTCSGVFPMSLSVKMHQGIALRNDLLCLSVEIKT